MHRFSTCLSVVLIGTVFACFVVPRGDGVGTDIPPAPRKVDFSASGIDTMPVGTAKQVAKAKHLRNVRKA